MITWNLEVVKLSKLNEYIKNPRTLDKTQAHHLKESIEKFGLCEPIVINTDFTIIGGHQRVRTLKSLNIKEAQVFVPSRALSEKEFEELHIRLNKNVGDWDFDILANVWNLEDLVQWGFTLDELEIQPEKQSEKKQSYKMNITFENADDMKDSEPKIRQIVEAYYGAKIKLSLK